MGVASANTKAAYQGLNNPGHVTHLYLYEKDSNWEIVEDGAWGKLSIVKDEFVFNAHELTPDTEYTLIRYQDPWPGSPVCVGQTSTNEDGNYHVAGDWLDGGNKVWLVLSEDVDCEASKMVGWNPSEYLFEYNVLD